LRSRQRPMHLLRKATSRESQPVNPVTSNSKKLSAVLSPKDCLMLSRLGSLLCDRQFPKSKTRNTPGDVRSSAKIGLEAVSVTGLVQQLDYANHRAE